MKTIEIIGILLITLISGVVLITIISKSNLMLKSSKNITVKKFYVEVDNVSVESDSNLYEYDINLTLNIETTNNTIIIPVIKFKHQNVKCTNNKGIFEIKEGGNKIPCNIHIKTDFSPVFECTNNLSLHETVLCNNISITLAGFIYRDTINKRFTLISSTVGTVDDYEPLFILSEKIRNVLPLKKTKYTIILYVNKGSGDILVPIYLDGGCNQGKTSWVLEKLTSDGYKDTKPEIGGCEFCKIAECSKTLDPTCELEKIKRLETDNGFKWIRTPSGEFWIKINSIFFDKILLQNSITDKFLEKLGEYGMFLKQDPPIVAIEDFEFDGKGEMSFQSPLEISLFPGTCDYLNSASSSKGIGSAIIQCNIISIGTKILYIPDRADDYGIVKLPVARCNLKSHQGSGGGSSGFQ